MNFCMAGFVLKNTLSDNGAVTRGICRVNEEGYLAGVEETGGILRTKDGAACERDGVLCPLNPDSHVSMNMWGLTPEFLPLLEKGFLDFFARLSGNELKGEYLLPIFIDELIQNGQAEVKVLEPPAARTNLRKSSLFLYTPACSSTLENTFPTSSCRTDIIFSEVRERRAAIS